MTLAATRPAAAKPGFFVAGGTLLPDTPSYVERQADSELYEHVLAGDFCYVLTSRQTGKSSLMARTVLRLRSADVLTAPIDLTWITERVESSSEQWYFGIAEAIREELDIEVDLGAWWDRRGRLTSVQRMVKFLREVVLASTGGHRVVIFVDEIDSTIGLPFADDFFAAIRACHNLRAVKPDFRRLSFVLLGTASPSELIGNRRRTPFNVGTRIDLADFSFEEARKLAVGLSGNGRDAEGKLRCILRWTGGHPYLTQKVCDLVAREGAGLSDDGVDAVIEKNFFAEGADRRDFNLRFVRDRLLSYSRQAQSALRIYRRILQGESVFDDPQSSAHSELKLSGLVRPREDGRLDVRNEIYRKVFDTQWVRSALSPQARDGSVVVEGSVINSSVVIAADRHHSIWRISSEEMRDARRIYLNYIYDRYRYLDLRGMGVAARVPWRIPLLDIVVPLKARPNFPMGETWDRQRHIAGRRHTEQVTEPMGLCLSEPRAVNELIREHDGLIILGDPGSGKTTFLKALAVACAVGQSENLGLGARMPILMPLSAFANALREKDVGLNDFIDEYFRGLGFHAAVLEMLKTDLKAGRALLLFDGLDEIQEIPWRQAVVRRVLDFFISHRSVGNKFVMTSRIIGYREVRPVAEDLAECTLLDFDDEEIDLFVEQWTAALEPQAQSDTRVAPVEVERERRELLDAIQRHPGVRQLAANPLLLTILALMKSQGVSLPERRVELYDLYVRTLLSSWNRARGLDRPSRRDLDVVETIRILAPLALWMHEVSAGLGLVKREAILRQLEEIFRARGEEVPEDRARAFLADIREYAGLLLERAPGEYGFIHLTLEEYLAAVEIAVSAQGKPEEITRRLAKRLDEPAWHEVALLAIGYVGLIQQLDVIASSVLAALANKPGPAVVLAGEALLDIGPSNSVPRSRRAVIKALRETVQDEAVVPALRRQARLLLGRLGWAVSLAAESG